MKDYTSLVIKNTQIAHETYQITFQLSEPLPPIVPGQFVNVQLENKARILRRPLGIADYSIADNTFSLIYRIRGAGTEELSQTPAGTILNVLMPLGNGFDEITDDVKRIMFIGGGTGGAVFPTLPTTFADKEIHCYQGYATKHFDFISPQANRIKSLVITTDDGSLGEKGNIVQKALADIPKINPDIIVCCGPDIVYKLLKKGLPKNAPPTYISLEGQMCCGFGACFVCACKINLAGKTHTLRVCKAGPVFDINDWQENWE